MPLGFDVGSYRMVFKNPMILRYINTVIIVLLGLPLTLYSSVGAYSSRKNVLWKNAIMIMIVVTMYFNGGLIPFYLTVKALHLDNSYLALIFPVAINTFNLIIMRTSFASIPDSLEESARIDGASHFNILFRIIIPLSKATIAVMILYYSVGHWNSWFNAMIFIRKRELFPLQLILREILIQNDTSNMSIGVDAMDRESVAESIKYAIIIVATSDTYHISIFAKVFCQGSNDWRRKG